MSARKPDPKELLAVIARWRQRETRFMDEAHESRNPLDIARLTAMASTMRWAAMDLSVYVKPDGSEPLK